MAKQCKKCGNSLSLLEKLDNDLCGNCKSVLYEEALVIAQQRRNDAESVRQESAAARYDRAIQGTASNDDLRALTADGYHLVAGKFISCPICGHERFYHKRVLMNTRLATFFGYDWLNREVDARACRECKHILWFDGD